MSVKVRFFTSLREIVNKKEEALRLTEQEATVAKVLETLSEKYGSKFREYVFDQKKGKPRGYLQFLVNGNSVETQNGLETQLRDGDVLAILPPVGGG